LILRPASDNQHFMRPVIVNRFPNPGLNCADHLFSRIFPDIKYFGKGGQFPVSCGYDNKLVLCTGRNEGEQGGHNFPGAESLRGRQMTAGGAEKSQQCHMYILQYSKFASKRSQVRTVERQTCFLPRALSNIVTPLVVQLTCQMLP